jgi:hypothetical protein
MKNLSNQLDKFLDEDGNFVDSENNESGVKVIKKFDGLQEKKIIRKKVLLEDGRELLREG